MARLAPRRPRRLWADKKYDLHTIACGAPVLCVRGESLDDEDVDYTCSHASFLVQLRRFASEKNEDVVFRFEPVHDDAGAQIGVLVQFFWDLMPSRGDRVPEDFEWPRDGSSQPEPDRSPYVRPKYKVIPPDMRAPVSLS